MKEKEELLTGQYSFLSSFLFFIKRKKSY